MAESEKISSEFTETTPLEIQNKVIDSENRKFIVGIIAGLFCIVIGIVLLYLGISGSISWGFSGWGVESELANATPGVILVIIGFFIIVFTRPNIKIKK